MQLGKYRHYKGKEYQVIGIATHSETLEKLVMYTPLYDNDPTYPKGSFWVRPLEMFQEKIVVDGKEVGRFTYIGE